MTTPRPTADPGLPDLPDWLPDEATMNRLAAEFFAAVPAMPEVPTVPLMPAAREGRVPDAAGSRDSGRVEHAPRVDVPASSSAAPAVPGAETVGEPAGIPAPADLFGFVGLGSLPTGEPYAAGLPSIPQPPIPAPDTPFPVPTPSTPYYFIAESNPYREEIQRAFGDLQLDPAASADPGALATAPAVTAPAAAFDVRAIRRDFPILDERVNGKRVVWLDNAATTQKPQAVLDRLAHFYRHENSNIHRAAHELAARATDAYEGARKTVARFLGAGSEKEIVFVRGATEAINLVAKSWGRATIRRGDEIIVSHLEHHANIVPWQQLIAETGATLRVIPVDDSGQLILSEFSRVLSDRTKLVAVTHVSNALGTVTPVHEIVEMGHRAGACVLIDGAQSVPHLRVNLQSLGADFFVFSGHKIFGPTGIGVLYGREEVLESMPPWEGGGNMIADVTFEKTVYQHPPNRFEAGTGNIADAVGLGAALDYVSRIGVESIAAYEHHLLEYATPLMNGVPGLRLIGTARDKASVLSFVLDGYRTEEVGSALNQEGIAVRSGHHCAQPILRRFGVESTVRPSLAFYNTTDEVDLMVDVLHRLVADRGGR